MRIITFKEIVDYVGDFSRPLTEGSLAMDNITFGTCDNPTNDNNIKHFFALCMSLTDPKKQPYEVNVLNVCIEGSALKMLMQLHSQRAGTLQAYHRFLDAS